jgi:hypothetical protein
MPLTDREILSWHESGHVVCAQHFGCDASAFVTDENGKAWYSIPRDRVGRLHLLVCTMGGFVAEKLFDTIPIAPADPSLIQHPELHRTDPPAAMTTAVQLAALAEGRAKGQDFDGDLMESTVKEMKLNGWTADGVAEWSRVGMHWARSILLLKIDGCRQIATELCREGIITCERVNEILGPFPEKDRLVSLARAGK